MRQSADEDSAKRVDEEGRVGDILCVLGMGVGTSLDEYVRKKERKEKKEIKSIAKARANLD